MAGKAAKAYWSEKTCFRDVDVNLVDWKTIQTMVKGQTISSRRWTAKFTTGFCATGLKMTQMKKGQQRIALNVDNPMKTPSTFYNAQTQNHKYCGTRPSNN